MAIHCAPLAFLTDSKHWWIFEVDYNGEGSIHFQHLDYTQAYIRPLLVGLALRSQSVWRRPIMIDREVQLVGSESGKGIGHVNGVETKSAELTKGGQHVRMDPTYQSSGGRLVTATDDIHIVLLDDRSCSDGSETITEYLVSASRQTTRRILENRCRVLQSSPPL